MKELPEDGCLEEITAPASNPDNIIIIRRSEEFKEPGETTYTFATFDRTKEGVEWPGDKYLEKIIPELPKVKVPELSKSEEMTETDTQYSQNIKNKYYQKPVQRCNYFPSRRSRPPYKKFHQNRSEHYTNNVRHIDPWIKKPWENSSFQGLNTATSVNTTSLISNAPFNNSCIQNVPTSHPFVPSPNSNNYNLLNNNEINMFPAAASNNQFLNNHMEIINMPPVRMPNGLFHQPSDRFSNQHPIHPNEIFAGLCPTQNININHSNHQTGLFGETKMARYNVKQGLLGHSPLPNIPFNRNSSTFPMSISAQSDPKGNTATLLSQDQKIMNNQNDGSYDTGYGRNSRQNFNQYNDNKMYRNKSNNFSKYPSKNSRGSYRKNFGRFKKGSARVNHSKTNYMQVENDKIHEDSYNEGRVNNVSKTSSFRNNQARNPEEDSLVHISHSAVVYNPEDFQNNEYPVTATNSDRSSNVNSMSRSKIRQNNQTKNTRWTTNNRRNKVKYNQGQQKFRN